MKRILLFILFLSLACLTCWGQVPITVTAIGKSKAGEKDAVKEALANAAHKAGVDVWTQNTLAHETSKPTTFKGQTITTSQARLKILDCETSRERGFYKATVTVEALFVSALPMVNISNLRDSYPKGKPIRPTLGFTDPCYLTILWFANDNTGNCGFVENATYWSCRTRVWDDFMVELSKACDGCVWEECEPTNGGVMEAKRVYDYSNVTMSGSAMLNAKNAKPTSKPKPKNITLLFITTPSEIPFTPVKEWSFTREEVNEWFFNLPIEQRRRIVEKNITIEL